MSASVTKYILKWVPISHAISFERAATSTPVPSLLMSYDLIYFWRMGKGKFFSPPLAKEL